LRFVRFRRFSFGDIRAAGNWLERTAKVETISSLFVVGAARFDAHDQVLTLPQVNPLGDRRAALGVQTQLQQRPQRNRREDVDVAVQVRALNRDQ